MYAWIPRASDPAGAGVPSPLLNHLAGDFAPRIAGLWREPHAVFLTAAADRRHLVLVALTYLELSRELADGLLHWPMARAIRAALPQAPDGLGRALKLLGETGWAAADYRRLLNLLAEPNAAKRLRHTGRILPSDLLALEETPTELLRAGLARLGLDRMQVSIVREAWETVRARDGEEVAQAAAMRWGGATSPGRLRKHIDKDLLPPIAPEPFPAHPKLRQLRDEQAIRTAAGRYRNCLVNHLVDAASRDSAYFEWLGEPGAVIEVRRDWLRTWVLEQARLAGNESIPDETRPEMIEALQAIGVHVGRSGWGLDGALDDALLRRRQPRSLASIVAGCFAD
jgi:hypothetical protein